MAPFVDGERPTLCVFLVAAEAGLYIKGEYLSEEIEYVHTVAYAELVMAVSEEEAKIVARKQLLGAVADETVEFDMVDIQFSEIKEMSREELKEAAAQARPRKEVERQKK